MLELGHEEGVLLCKRRKPWYDGAFRGLISPAEAIRAGPWQETATTFSGMEGLKPRPQAQVKLSIEP